MPGTATISWINNTVLGITQVQKKTYVSGDNTSHTIVLDAAPTEGNLLILAVVSSVINTPSGWTLVHSQGTAYLGHNVFYKIAGASESASITVTVQFSDNACIQCLEYSGIDTASPLDVASEAVQTVVGSITGTTLGTTSQADELIFVSVGIAADPGGGGDHSIASYNNSFTEENEVHSGGTPYFRLSTGTKIVSSTGAYGVVGTYDVNSSVADGDSIIMAAFKGAT